jgi:cyclin-dependent kinase regulatory subunit CKS1
MLLWILITQMNRIHYSDRYSDDEYEYRHVILPKQFLKMIPKQFFNDDNTGTLRLLEDEEWRGLGITQSLGWEHYEVHGITRVFHCVLCSKFPIAPEPHVLLFRRSKNFVPPPQPPASTLAPAPRRK